MSSSSLPASAKSVLVTGSGSGLGREIAVQCARRGVAVAVLDIRAEAARETEALCREAGATDVLTIADDLTRSGAPADAIDRAVERWGRIDVLVNNAGYGGIESFFDMTAELWNRTVSLNLVALALTCSAAGRAMRERRSGRIVNITSPASRMATSELRRLCREQGRSRFDHPRRRDRARALWGAGQ